MKKQINEEVESIQKQVDEWKTKYLRVLADYQNLERRNRQEWEEKRAYAGELVIRKFLPVLDTLAKAGEHIQDPGLELGIKLFASTLAELGIEKIEVVGKLFDPAFMDCVETVEGQENIVIEELLTGYRLHNKLLRAAKVNVGKPSLINESQAAH